MHRFDENAFLKYSLSVNNKRQLPYSRLLVAYLQIESTFDVVTMYEDLISITASMLAMADRILFSVSISLLLSRDLSSPHSRDLSRDLLLVGDHLLHSLLKIKNMLFIFVDSRPR